ncbi:hypothetical protein, partial [Mycobacteroides abscessus]|uniref:hypothetical protein n=1 Tax=Mycobacteroides abscessus TaxID=36809 RepID=UPI001C26F163
ANSNLEIGRAKIGDGWNRGGVCNRLVRAQRATDGTVGAVTTSDVGMAVDRMQWCVPVSFTASIGISLNESLSEPKVCPIRERDVGL